MSAVRGLGAHRLQGKLQRSATDSARDLDHLHLACWPRCLIQLCDHTFDQFHQRLPFGADQQRVADVVNSDRQFPFE